jgi:hypothetical protein
MSKKIWNFLLLYKSLKYDISHMAIDFNTVLSWHIYIVYTKMCYVFVRVLVLMDLFPNEQNFDLDKSRQTFHHSLKEHHKISNIP